jgi:glycosyltransferase involved in cell wall biosynthesis
MKILVALTYYRPHVSGLTIYVQRLSHALVERGHEVTIMTSQYDRMLPRQEVLDGVKILRAPVAFRVSKGVIMPTIGLMATAQARKHDVLSLHLPQLDAAGIALRGRLFNKPTTVTYHSDLLLPPGVMNRLAGWVVEVANRATGALADRVIAYTEDFATHSPYLSRYLSKVEVIPPPVEVAQIPEREIQAFRDRHVTDGGPVIGMAARLASEKGVEYLLEALPRVRQEFPKAQVLFAGQHENVLGEASYAKRLKPLLEREGDRWKFLGTLDSAAMAAFFHTCDVTVLPSLNNTETFGLVQIESMMCGTPSIASNLPGVRQPVTITGMGKVVPIGDATQLRSLKF